jgi:hypothetical protein
MPKDRPAHHNRLSVKVYKKIAIIFLGPVLILAGVVLAATISRATILISANQVPVSTSAKVNVAGTTATSDTVMGKVFSATLDDTASVKPKGNGVTKDQPATGTVTLVNKRAATQTLIATTRLLSAGGILFRIKNRVNVPAGGELKNVAVYADKPGASGDIDATTFIIPGLPAALQKSVYATSDAPMSGGTITVIGVSNDDINGAISDLNTKLTAKALATFADAIRQSGYDGIVSKTDEVSRQVSAKVGDTVDSFTVEYKVTVTAVAFDRAKFNNVASGIIDQAVPSDLDLKSSNVETVVPVIQNADASAGTATLVANLAGTATLSGNNSILNKDRLTGLTADEVVNYLKSYSAVSDAKVSLWPFWVRKTPSMKNHIQVKVE